MKKEIGGGVNKRGENSDPRQNKMKKYLSKFLEPMPVMFYLFFIGLLIGIEDLLGFVLTFVGLFFGTMLLVVNHFNK